MSLKAAIYMSKMRSINALEKMKERSEEKSQENKSNVKSDCSKKKAPKGLRRHRLPR